MRTITRLVAVTCLLGGVLSGATLAFAASASAGPRALCLSDRLRGHLGEVQFELQGVRIWPKGSPFLIPLKAGILPLYLGMKGAYAARDVFRQSGGAGVWKIPFRVFDGELPTLAFFGMSYFLAHHMLVQDYDFLRWTDPEFLPPGFDGLTVIVNGFDPKVHALLYEITKHRFEKRYSGQRQFVYVEAMDWFGLRNQLGQIAADRGPIQRLELNAHGLPSLVQLGQRGRVTAKTLQMAPLPFGVMAPGAKIRLFSCLSGAGDAGEVFLRQLGQATLRQGGAVFGSQLLVLGRLNEGSYDRNVLKELPLEEWGQLPAHVVFSFYRWNGYTYDALSESFRAQDGRPWLLWNPIRRVEVPPAPRPSAAQ